MNQRSEVNDMTPSSLSHIVGQESVVQQVVTALDASQMDARKFDHSLLVGPPGLGKSLLANIIAKEMATNLHEVLGQAIRNPAALFALLLAAKDRDVIHVDECHELGKPFQTSLYLALDKRKIILGGNKGGSPKSLPLSDFTVPSEHYRRIQPTPTSPRPDAADTAFRILFAGRTGDSSQTKEPGSWLGDRRRTAPTDRPTVKGDTQIGTAAFAGMPQGLPVAGRDLDQGGSPSPRLPTGRD